MPFYDLTEAQQVDVRAALGYDRGRDLHPTLETRFTGWLNASEGVQLVVLLAAITALRAKILDSALVNLDLKTGDGVTFLGPEQLDALRSHGRYLVGQLCQLFAVEPLRDTFAVGGCSGGLIDIG